MNLKIIIQKLEIHVQYLGIAVLGVSAGKQ